MISQQDQLLDKLEGESDYSCSTQDVVDMLE